MLNLIHVQLEEQLPTLIFHLSKLTWPNVVTPKQYYIAEPIFEKKYEKNIFLIFFSVYRSFNISLYFTVSCGATRLAFNNVVFASFNLPARKYALAKYCITSTLL